MERTAYTKQVRQFLGLCAYYRQHIKDFEELKVTMQNPPVLKLFEPGKDIIIDADASLNALEAVSSQKDEEGLEHPVAYYSRCLNHAETQYCCTRSS
jgi:hypothetical protein